MTELISVVMSVYNEDNHEVSQAINSILNQTYSNFELIIVNDNPKNTELPEILTDFQKKDQRIVLLNNNKNIGVAKTLNKAIEIAKGQYLARMDADDISHPERFVKELRYLKDGNFDVVTTNAQYINENDELAGQHSFIPRGPKAYEELLTVACNIIHPSVMMKKSSVDAVNGYRALRCEDYDLWLRMLDHGYKIGGIDENLMSYRIRNSGVTQSKPLLMYYASQYVRNLAKQRKLSKKLTDDFSQSNFEKYLSIKKYTETKELAFVKALQANGNKFLRIFKILSAPSGVSFMYNDLMFKVKLKKFKKL